MSALALDLGTYSVKAVAGKPGSAPTIERVAEAFNPHGLALPADDAQQQKLGEFLDSFFTDHKLPRTDVRLSLPETVVSTTIIELPNLSDAELASAIGWQAEQHIPIPKEELSLQYQVLFRPARGDKKTPMRVLLVGSRKSVVERYTNLLLDLGIEPKLLETQILSIMRNLQISAQEPTTLILHMGASTLDMAVIQTGEMRFVFSHPNGGQLLTKALQQAIGLDAEQAEQYKRTYGLDPSQFEGKVRAALEPTFGTMVAQVKKAVTYFASQQPNDAVKRVVLSGGTSQLPGLVEYLTQALGAEVLLSSPFSSAHGQIPQTNLQAYSVCMGLLMRNM